MWVELPEARGRLLFLSQLCKGAGHKYIKRVPYTDSKGRRRYRYFYKVSAGYGVQHEFHFVEGAAFRVAGGHYHVTKVDGDRLTIKHDETGEVLTVTKAQLSGMLGSHHAEALEKYRGELKTKLESATGNAQRGAITARLKRFGGKVPLKEALAGAKPKAEEKSKPAPEPEVPFPTSAPVAPSALQERAAKLAAKLGPGLWSDLHAVAQNKPISAASSKQLSDAGLMDSSRFATGLTPVGKLALKHGPTDTAEGVRIRRNIEPSPADVDHARKMTAAVGINWSDAVGQGERKVAELKARILEHEADESAAYARQKHSQDIAGPTAGKEHYDSALMAGNQADRAVQALREERAFLDAAREKAARRAAQTAAIDDANLASRLHRHASDANDAAESIVAAMRPPGKEAREIAVRLLGKKVPESERVGLRRRANEILSEAAAAKPKPDLQPATSMSKDEIRAELKALSTERNPIGHGPKPVREKPMVVGNPERFQAIVAREQGLREALGNEPWQRTSDEVLGAIGMPKERHRRAVKEALETGKTVPGHVLSEYPDLDAGAEKEPPLVSVSVDDIPYSVAHAAHSGTSHTPEIRAKSEQQGFVDHIEGLAAELGAKATTPEQREQLRVELEKYKAGYKSKLMAYLGSRAGIFSTLVAGRSNFPVRRMEKKNAVADKRREELLDWSAAAQKRIRRDVLGIGASKAIRSDDAEATAKIGPKLEQLEKQQAMYVAVNKIVRGKGTDEEKIARMVSEHGMGTALARQMLEPDYAGRKGFPDYVTKNNSAEIRRLKQREAAVSVEQAKPTKEHEFDGGTIEDNAEDGRVRILFDSKPDRETISKLKASGFRWAPSVGAWQRQRTNAARYAAEQITGAKLSQSDIVKASAPRRPVIGALSREQRSEYPFAGTIDAPGGIKVDVENRAGSTRSGAGPDGTWSVKMRHHYGEIRGTEGVDGDPLDVYVGDDLDSPLVVVVHQQDPKTKRFDENKVMLGWRSVADAVKAYKAQYDKPGFYGGHTAIPVTRFWRWVQDGKGKGKAVAKGMAPNA